MEIHLEPGVDGLGIYGSISPVTPRGGVSDTVRRQVPGTYSTRGFLMDLDMIITHLDNFVDTWKGWGKVLGGLSHLVNFELGSILDLSSQFDGASSNIIETSSESVELSSGLIKFNDINSND